MCSEGKFCIQQSKGCVFHGYPDPPVFTHFVTRLPVFINAQTGNLKLAQRLLGHSEISTTADICPHTTDEVEREAGLALERAIFGDLFPTCSQKGTGTRNVVGTQSGQPGQVQ